MKIRAIYPLFPLVVLGMLGSCNSSKAPSGGSSVDGSDSISPIQRMESYNYGNLNYALGVSAGTFIKSQDIQLDKKEFLRGLTEAFAGESTLSEQETQSILQDYFSLKRESDAERALNAGKAFLDSVSRLEGVQQDSSGLLYRINVEGTGAHPSDTSLVQIHYEARFVDGKVFDKSEEGTPVVLGLSQVIQGWVIGIPKMREGGKATLYIPPSLAYGEYGREIVPGNSTLIFDVELVKILSPEEVELHQKGAFK